MSLPATMYHVIVYCKGLLKRFALKVHRLPHGFLDICSGDVYSHEAVISDPKRDHHVKSVLPSPFNGSYWSYQRF